MTLGRAVIVGFPVTPTIPVPDVPAPAGHGLTEIVRAARYDGQPLVRRDWLPVRVRRALASGPTLAYRAHCGCGLSIVVQAPDVDDAERLAVALSVWMLTERGHLYRFTPGARVEALPQRTKRELPARQLEGELQ